MRGKHDPCSGGLGVNRWESGYREDIHPSPFPPSSPSHSFNGASSPTTSRRSAVTTWLDISWYDL